MDQPHRNQPIPDGQASFAALSAELAVEVRLDGARHVQPMPASGPLTVILSTTRLDAVDAADAGAEDTVLEIDRGAGWEPFADGMDLVPGWIAFRLESGEGSSSSTSPRAPRSRVPSGVITPITVVLERPRLLSRRLLPHRNPRPPLQAPTSTATPEPSPTATTDRSDATDETGDDSDSEEPDAATEAGEEPDAADARPARMPDAATMPARSPATTVER